MSAVRGNSEFTRYRWKESWTEDGEFDLIFLSFGVVERECLDEPTII